MTMMCEICGGRIYQNEPAAKIKVGRYGTFLSRIFGGAEAVAHLSCIDRNVGDNIEDSGEICKELFMKLAKDEKVNTK